MSGRNYGDRGYNSINFRDVNWGTNDSPRAHPQNGRYDHRDESPFGTRRSSQASVRPQVESRRSSQASSLHLGHSAFGGDRGFHPEYYAGSESGSNRSSLSSARETWRSSQASGSRRSSKASSLHLSHSAFGGGSDKGLHAEHYDDEEGYPAYYEGSGNFPGESNHFGPNKYGNNTRNSSGGRQPTKDNLVWDDLTQKWYRN
jgi:hypothetical protein